MDVRSMEEITDADLERLARVADADLGRFFERNPHQHEWRERIFAVALVQGAAEHRLRGERGIWDLDVIVCFDGPRSRHLRRQVVHWDWGLSRLGRCPYDPREYTGRAVDVKFWVFPARPDPAEALRAWLEARLRAAPDPRRSPDVAHDPVILIWPPDRLGEVVWDRKWRRRRSRRPRRGAGSRSASHRRKPPLLAAVSRTSRSLPLDASGAGASGSEAAGRRASIQNEPSPE
jgi:hypothetical protein